MGYGAVDRQTWNDEKFRSWDRDTRDVWLYLLTCPHGNRIGCFVLDPLYVASDVQISRERASACLEKLDRERRIVWDSEVRVVCVVRHLHPEYNPLANQNVVKAAVKDLKNVPKSMRAVGTLLWAILKWGRPHYKELEQALRNRLPKGTQRVAERTLEGYAEFTRAFPDPDPDPDPSTVGSSLRSSPTGASPDVENPKEGDEEPWNARLAPLIREVAYDGRGPPNGHSVSKCLSKAKELMGKGYTVGDLERAIRGLREMAEAGHETVRGWIKPGDRFTMLCFGRAEEQGQKLVNLAAHEWRKHGEATERSTEGLTRVSAGAGR